MSNRRPQATLFCSFREGYCNSVSRPNGRRQRKLLSRVMLVGRRRMLEVNEALSDRIAAHRDDKARHVRCTVRAQVIRLTTHRPVANPSNRATTRSEGRASRSDTESGESAPSGTTLTNIQTVVALERDTRSERSALERLTDPCPRLPAARGSSSSMLSGLRCGWV